MTTKCTGTAASYARGCRCDRCSAADKARRLKRLQNGEPSYRRPLKARRHLHQLLSAGMSRRQIQVKSGVDFATIRDLLDGKSKRILDRTERAILATRPSIDAWCYVDATATIARIQRMRKQGYSKEWIAEQLGLHDGGSLPKPGNTRCRAFVAKRVRDLAEFTEGCAGVARDGLPNGRRALSNDQRRALAEKEARVA